jgi:hypothetical protein
VHKATGKKGIRVFKSDDIPKSKGFGNSREEIDDFFETASINELGDVVDKPGFTRGATKRKLDLQKQIHQKNT